MSWRVVWRCVVPYGWIARSLAKRREPQFGFVTSDFVWRGELASRLVMSREVTQGADVFAPVRSGWVWRRAVGSRRVQFAIVRPRQVRCCQVLQTKRPGISPPGLTLNCCFN